jgi:flavin-dependent dehydrogenase
MKANDVYDAVIIGGGPAGCSAAIVLSEKGRRVLILEREKFPRYHVGESLLPFTFYPLQRLGLIEAMKQSDFVKKFSVQFVSASGKASDPFYFFERYDRETVAQTWQVLRSEFDEMVMRRARSSGAEALEEITVTDLIESDGRVMGVKALQKDSTQREFFGKIILDCTGKESFAALKKQWRLKDPFLNKVAVWTYYDGALRDEGIDEGATTVAFVPEKGWFWYIPQHRNRVSVGVVADGKYLSRGGVKSPEAIFKREIEQNAWIKSHLDAGRQEGPYYITSEYSYHSRHCGSEGLLLVGDAFCFLDPVFSSGLMLALKSGVMAGDAIEAGLVAGNLGPERFTEYGRKLRQGVENMRKLVYAFYDPDFSFRALIERYPDAGGLVTDCLAGDLDRDYSMLWKWISDFAKLPEDLPVGLPMTRGARPVAATLAPA